MSREIKTVLINTNYRDSAGAKVCVDDLSKRMKQASIEVTHNDWKYKGTYDVILFMSPDSDVQNAKRENPHSVIGIMDPKLKNERRIEDIKHADFLLVSSIEQRERLLPYNKHIIIYYMFPDIKSVEKEHTKKEVVRIGYHGSKRHLHNFHPDINNALDKLAEKYNVELVAVYNIAKLGKWEKPIPKNIEVRHVQWSEESYCDEIRVCDIGIAPNLISIQENKGLVKTQRWFEEKVFGYRFRYRNNDFLIRFKYSTNPGRIYVFSQLGIPVVSDFAPSSSQFIQDGKSGLIAHGESGWFTAIEKLVNDHQLRQAMADNMRSFIEEHYSIGKNFERLLSYINDIKKQKYASH